MHDRVDVSFVNCFYSSKPDSGAMFPGRFPNIPDSMWNFGWNPQTMGLHGQFCGGDPMGQQSQAQAQAQISALQQQNAMLNQHLHSQAQSYINHLQQLIPFHQPPQPFQLRQLHSNPHHNHQCHRHQIHRHLRPLRPIWAFHALQS